MIWFALILLAIGGIGIIFKENILLKLLSLAIMNAAVVALFVTIAGYHSHIPPILTGLSQRPKTFANPLPQAVIITSIVIGFATMALAIAFAMNISLRTGTPNASKLEERLFRDDNH